MKVTLKKVEFIHNTFQFGLQNNMNRDWNIDIKQSVIIGDTWRDVGAGKAAGITTIMIDWGYDDQFKLKYTSG